MKDETDKTVFCPASMCPLIAPNGSPWTGQKNSPCPQHDDLDNGGCPWWTLSCNNLGHHEEIDHIEKANGRAFVLGPNKPRAEGIKTPKTFECPKESSCSWHINAQQRGVKCPPRYALEKGLDPRICLF